MLENWKLPETCWVLLPVFALPFQFTWSPCPLSGAHITVPNCTFPATELPFAEPASVRFSDDLEAVDEAATFFRRGMFETPQQVKGILARLQLVC